MVPRISCADIEICLHNVRSYKKCIYNPGLSQIVLGFSCLVKMFRSVLRGASRSKLIIRVALHGADELSRKAGDPSRVFMCRGLLKSFLDTHLDILSHFRR